MSQENNEKRESTYTAPVKQPQKISKLKSIQPGITNSLINTDITKPISNQQRAVILNSQAEQSKKQQNENKEDPPEGTYLVKVGDSISEVAKKHGITSEQLIQANPGEIYGTTKKFLMAGHTIVIPKPESNAENTEEKKEVKQEKTNEKPSPQENKVPETDKNKEVKVKEEQKEKEKKENTIIDSFVGDTTKLSSKNVITNMGEDVALVQMHLNRLNILTDENYSKEKATGNGQISMEQIPLTIAAIHWFQKHVLHYNTYYGHAEPGKNTIKQLVAITPEQKDAKYQEFLNKKKEQEEKKAAEEKRKKQEELAKAINEKLEKVKQEYIKAVKAQKPPTWWGTMKIWAKYASISGIAKDIKYLAIYNPQYILAFFRHTRSTFLPPPFNIAGYLVVDDLAYEIVKRLSDSEIAQLPEKVDKLFYKEMEDGITTKDEREQMQRLKYSTKVNEGKEEKKEEKVTGKSKKDAEKDLQTIREIVGYRMKGPVGKKDGAKNINDQEDVKQSAIQLQKKGYTVSENSLKKGTCDQTFIDALGKFQTDNNIVKDGKPFYYMNANKGCYKKLFGSKGEFNSGLTNMYGHGTKTLNKKLGKEDAKLERLKRHLVYDKKANKSTGYFVESKTISQSDYKKSIEKIGKAYGVKKDSDASKILDIVDKAVNDKDYYNAITQSVSAKLDLKAKSLGSNSVNKLLEHRLERYHKLLVALGLFSGNMTGSACRKEETAHCWSIYYYWKTGHSKLSIVKSNIVKMYNKELKPEGKVCVDKSGNVKDLDGNIWAKKEHFNFDDKSKAKSLNSKWDTYMDKISQSRVSREEDGTIKRDWRLSAAAEGYNYDNPKRYPMPLSGGMGRSKHITGDAIDINSPSFNRRNDAINDLIALRFGLIRPVGGEQWHFEITNVAFSKEEKKKITTKE